MNITQKKLYEYLLNKNGEWTTHAEIARDLFEHYGNAECCLEPKDFHNTAERSWIAADCRYLSTCNEIDKIVISSSKGVKLATEQEFDTYIKSQYSATIRKLARIYKMAKKVNRHGQIDFGGHTVESFLENLPENS